LVEQNVVMVLTAVFAPPEAVLLQRVDFRSGFAVRLPQLRNYITAFLNVHSPCTQLCKVLVVMVLSLTTILV
jgi:hypothetical protein